MKKFAVAMSHKCRAWCFTPCCLLTSKMFKTSWKLSRMIRCLTHFCNKYSHCLKVCDMFTEVTRWFAPPIFRLVPKEHVQRPKFCIAECSELSRIRPKHKCRHNPGKIASRFTRQGLQFSMSVNESWRGIQFDLYSNRTWFIRRFPM